MRDLIYTTDDKARIDLPKTFANRHTARVDRPAPSYKSSPVLMISCSAKYKMRGNS